MAEPKPIASLSGVLLARKGAARPAMRRPTITGGAAVTQDDLGWNDMGYDVNPDPTTPMDYEHDSGFNPLAGAVPEVKPDPRAQQERIVEELRAIPEREDDAEAEPDFVAPALPIASAPAIATKAGSRPRAARGSKEKAAFTLRLDQQRHLKLRLACAVSNRSAQMLVTDALDAFLDAMPEVGQLASRVPGRGK